MTSSWNSRIVYLSGQLLDCARIRFLQPWPMMIIIWRRLYYYWSFVKGIRQSPVEFPHKVPVMKSFGVYFVLVGKLLNKYWNCWWFETHRSRHDNALISMGLPAKHFLINVVKQLSNRTNALHVLMPISSQRTYDAIITLWLRQNDVAISFRGNNDSIIASRVHWAVQAGARK